MSQNKNCMVSCLGNEQATISCCYSVTKELPKQHLDLFAVWSMALSC